MIFCSHFSSGQVVKILGVFQLLGAIIITSVGITIVVKFIEIDHVIKGTGTEVADSYIDMHWTVTYGAPIWMGLIISIAGAFGIFADIKPHKSKYVYGTLILNGIVVIFAILLVVFSHNAITWFDTCQYIYHTTTSSKTSTSDCTEKDKGRGKTMYWIVFMVTLLMIPLTIGMFVLLMHANRVLFEDGIYGDCFGKSRFNGKDEARSHQFSKEMVPVYENSHIQRQKQQPTHQENGKQNDVENKLYHARIDLQTKPDLTNNNVNEKDAKNAIPEKKHAIKNREKPNRPKTGPIISTPKSSDRHKGNKPKERNHGKTKDERSKKSSQRHSNSDSSNNDNGGYEAPYSQQKSIYDISNMDDDKSEVKSSDYSQPSVYC